MSQRDWRGWRWRAGVGERASRAILKRVIFSQIVGEFRSGLGSVGHVPRQTLGNDFEQPLIALLVRAIVGQSAFPLPVQHVRDGEAKLLRLIFREIDIGVAERWHTKQQFIQNRSQ